MLVRESAPAGVSRTFLETPLTMDVTGVNAWIRGIVCWNISIPHPPLYPLAGLQGVWSQFQLPPSKKASWTCRQLMVGLTYSDKQPFMLTFPPKVNSESPLHLALNACPRSGGSWSTWRELTQTRRKHTNSTHKKKKKKKIGKKLITF